MATRLSAKIGTLPMGGVAAAIYLNNKDIHPELKSISVGDTVVMAQGEGEFIVSDIIYTDLIDWDFEYEALTELSGKDVLIRVVRAYRTMVGPNSELVILTLMDPAEWEVEELENEDYEASVWNDDEDYEGVG